MPRAFLLTGFGAYGREQDNPTGAIARSLDGKRVGSLRIRGVQLPVAVDPAGRALRRLLEETRPVAALATGVAPGRSSVGVERAALNVLDSAIPDVRGRRYRDKPIRPDGPAAYFSTLPLRRILGALRAAGIPAELSNTAGTYLCNFAMYTLLDALARTRPEVPAGFLHVPQTPRMSVDRPGQPSMDLETTCRAIVIAVEEVARAAATPHRPPRPRAQSR